MENKNKIRNWALYIGIPIVLLIILSLVLTNQPTKNMKYSEVITYFRNDQVTDFELDLGSGEMVLTLNDSSQTKINYSVPSVTLLLDEITPYIEEYDKTHDEVMGRDYKRPAETSWLTSMIPMLLVLVVGVLFWWFMMKRLNASMGDAGKQMN